MIVIFSPQINSDLNNFGEQVITDSPQLLLSFTTERLHAIEKYIIQFLHTGKAYSA